MNKAFFFVVLLNSLFCESIYEFEPVYPYTETDLFKNSKQISELILQNRVNIIVEVGSYMGESTIFMANCLPPEGRVYAVDSWVGYPIDQYEIKRNFYKKFLSNVIHANCTSKIIPIHKTSLTASLTFWEHEKKVDMIYIDADHSYKAVYSDLMAWLPYLRDNGVLCGNLYSKFDQTEAIKKAVLDYASKRNKLALFEDYLWVIK